MADSPEKIVSRAKAIWAALGPFYGPDKWEAVHGTVMSPQWLHVSSDLSDAQCRAGLKQLDRENNRAFPISAQEFGRKAREAAKAEPDKGFVYTPGPGAMPPRGRSEEYRPASEGARAAALANMRATLDAANGRTR